jgi:HlyD family secretion protein
MNDSRTALHVCPSFLCAAVLLAVVLFGGGCGGSASNLLQGYIEGEFVYVASPLAGTLEKLEVQRGSQTKVGQLLFVLESTAEKAAFDETERRLAQARASLEDARKGKRPSELQSIEARIKEAQAALEFSDRELTRQEKLIEKPGATTEQDLERARSNREQNRQRVTQLQAELETARLGARPDQIAAEEANVRALEAALAKAEWELSEKRQMAPQSGRVFDVLYREGEWVAAGRPVVSILPPAGVKLRVYVPQSSLGSLQTGDVVTVSIDGAPKPFNATVTFISPKAEYTPPVIYSRETRQKFVFMVEGIFEPQVAVQLHPGQPVDVRFNLPQNQ